MKKKLFLFITCFFMFSSLAISLTYRNIQLSDQNIQLSEIIKREKEVKKNLKELEGQKGKSNSNYRDELPWLFTWKGAIIPLVVCGLITVPGARFLAKKIDSCFGTDDPDKKTFVIGIILFVILFFSLPPFLLAIAKYRDKSYKERYCLLWRDYWKPFVCFALSWLFFVTLVIYCSSDSRKK